MKRIVNPNRRLQEISQTQNRQRAHRGYLVENYDGIGQYILVALSRGSTASAYKARIASGDFGTGQVIPVGTPVIVTSIRGQIEILSMGAK